MSVKLIWITQNAEQIIADIARVSSPQNQGDDPERLLKALIKHRHWSPFEMASMCVEINTSRAIARQLLRHRSFSFQEFSQRWSEVDERLTFLPTPECRLQNTKDRALPAECKDMALRNWWITSAERIKELCEIAYQDAIKAGIAREVARVVLPEGLTPSRLYISGTLRSWIHYLQLRMKPDTQKEHRMLADQICSIFFQCCPAIAGVAINSKEQD
jgi:thymidylate synthase (FAD)